MKKLVDGVLMDMTAEEIAQREQDAITDAAKQEEIETSLAASETGSTCNETTLYYANLAAWKRYNLDLNILKNE